MQNSYSKDRAEYAGFGVRLAAWIVDSVIVSVGALIIRGVLAMVSLAVQESIFDTEVLFQYTVTDIIVYGCTAVYFILLTYYTGTTFGKRLFNLCVVSAGYSGSEEKSELKLWNVVYRETVGRFLSGILLGIGYLMMIPDSKKRSLHDRLADTEVIYAKRVKIYEIPIHPVSMANPVELHPEDTKQGYSLVNPETVGEKQEEAGKIEVTEESDKIEETEGNQKER